MEEIFKTIKGFPGYEISNQGNVRHGKRILKPFKVAGGRYLGINLMKNGIRFDLRIHRLVAAHFVENKTGKEIDYLVVDHKDMNKENNRADNLEWITQAENTKRAVKIYGNFKNKERMYKIREDLKTIYADTEMGIF